MGRKLINDGKSRQLRYYYNKKDKKEQTKASLINWDAPLMDIIDYFKYCTSYTELPIEQENMLREMVNLDIKNLICCVGRGASKTLCAGVASMYFSDQLSRVLKRPIHVLLVSSQIEIFSKIDNIFVRHPELKDRLRVEGRSMEIPAKEFEWNDTHGRVTRTIPSNNAIRARRCDVLILDECADIPDDIITAKAMPCLTGDINKLIALSTPHKRGWFTDKVGNLPSDYKLIQYSSKDLAWTRLTVERLQKELSEQNFEIEVNAQIPRENIRSVFNSRDVDLCIKEFLTYSGNHEKFVVGIDFGFSRSKCAIVVAEWQKGYRSIVGTWLFDNKTPNLYQQMGDIINMCWNLDKYLLVYADALPVGFIANLQKYSKAHIYAVNKTEQLKNQLIQQTYNLISTHHLKIPMNEPELIDQLKNFTKERKYNTDLCDALFMSVAEIPEIKESHSVWVANTNKFDHYLSPKWRDPSGKNSFKRGY